MRRPDILQGSYEGDHRKIEYETRCHLCRDRTCDSCGVQGHVTIYGRTSSNRWRELKRVSGVVTPQMIQDLVNQMFESSQMRLGI